MEWFQILAILFIALIALFLIGIPVAFAFFIVNLFAMYILLGGIIGINQFILSMYTSVGKFVLLPVPLFILMGSLIFHSNVATRMVNALDCWLGSIPGRLSIMSGLAGMVFGAMSGSSMASTALLGSTLAQEMFRKKYHVSMIAGPILASGGLAMVIPPSSIGVVLAGIAMISVERVLIAGILPGLLMGILYCAYTIIRCHLNPSLAPPYDVKGYTIRQKIASLFILVLPTSLLIFLVLGTIFLGLATPSEAAAFGVLGSLILAVLYRELTWKVVSTAIDETLKITGMVFLIIAGSTAFSQVLSFSGASRGLIEFVIGLEVSKNVIVFIMISVVVLLGTFMGQLAIIMIAIPLFMPIIDVMGVNSVWFAVLFLIALQIGETSPPFGMNLFVFSGMFHKTVPAKDMYLSALPYLGCDCVSMILIGSFPVIATLLPSLL